MKKLKWNQNWYFWKDGNENQKQLINLPHDAMLTEERVPELPNGNASGFYPGGKYLYEKTFMGEEILAGKVVLVEFEGIYMNSKVFLNHEEVGGWIYGYTNFYVDLTDKIRIGEENVLTVIADNSKTPNSRWYSGSGIYRDVNIYIGEKEYIMPDGIKVTTVSTLPAVVEFQIEAKKEAHTLIETEIYFRGKKVAEGMGETFRIEVPDAKLWDAETPNLYEAKSRLVKNGKIIDEFEIFFGIRKIEWNAEEGLLINGNSVKLKGACIHHDNGPLGACSVYKAERRRIKKLKELGYNAIRYAHNPTGRLFLEICDELGMYVLDETFDQWKIPQSTYDYANYFDQEWEKDVEALVRKDYSHPSVIMYCVGNEITDTGLPYGAALCGQINGLFKKLDASRPTTIANNTLLAVLAKKTAEKKAAEAQMTEDEKKAAEKENVGSQDVNNIVTLLPKIMASITAENQETLLKDVFAQVDIAGYNYGSHLYEATHELAPERVILSSETFPCKIGSNWKQIEEKPYLIGDFMWTAWDYLGEAGVGLPFYGSTQAPFSKDYPCMTAGCGSVDLTGHVESQGYYTAVVFGKYKKPYIAVRPVDHAGEEYTVGKWRLTDAVNSWSWPDQEGKMAEIEVYSIGREVELIQDGISLGKKTLELCRAFYQTEYRPGKLEAISYDENGIEIAREQLISATGKEQIVLQPEEIKIHADGTDLAYINILIADEQGVPWLLRDRQLTVEVTGAGKLVALASGNPETTEKFSDNSYTTYHGRLLAIVQSTGDQGKISISVTGNNLEKASADINAE